MLQIYNTLSRRKEVFTPLRPGQVRMYVCGMTTYDYCHIGHARMLIAFDVVRRWLVTSGYQVTFVRNITDIDDKIIKRAVENGETIGALTQRFIDYMHEDLAALAVLPPDHEPRATHYVPQMLDLIGLLERNQLAYVASNGDVNFAVRRFPGYGKLSGKSLDELRAGERVEVNDTKLDPLDFALWKSAKPNEPVEAQFASPWGVGRPGWHIECSAMACSLLGEQFDIHGGGADLQFPHHENEIAQSEGAYGHGKDRPFVNVWMHNGFVNIDNHKMSKSLGNFFTIRDVLKTVEPEVLRFFLLRTQYRSPFNYADTLIEDARQGLTRLYTALDGRRTDVIDLDWNNEHAARFKAAMDDDFNTPIAVAVLFDLASAINKAEPAVADQLAAQLKALAGMLGIGQQTPRDFLQAGSGATLDAATITQKIDQRIAAKKSRDFARADQLRDELTAAGIVLEDSPQGTTWRRK